MIPFNKPCITGNELSYVSEVLQNGKLSSGGSFTKKCNDFFSKQYNYKRTFLTTSATAALEAITLLLDLQPGDEIIVPSYTFVSSCNPFLLRGCKIVFADSQEDHPNIDHQKIESLITKKTKAIVVVHYAAMSCEMDSIMELASKHGIFVIEDAAHSINAFYKKKPLGGIGHFGILSFHDTKNITCGEGGLLVINDESFIPRAEILMEKGTNRSAFLKGEKQKYEWVDIGSSFGLSEINAAFLWAQLQEMETITQKRIELWNTYFKRLTLLSKEGKIELPPAGFEHNGHIFYLICQSEENRDKLCEFLKEKGVNAAFHYLSLHQSPYFKLKYQGPSLPFADKFTLRLLRLPLYDQLDMQEVDHVSSCISNFYR